MVETKFLFIKNDLLPTEQGKKRVNVAIQEYLNGNTNYLIMSGGFSQKEKPITQAEAMKVYAISQGIKKEEIILEEESLETVAQAAFTKKRIIVPNNWKNITVVSSNYHLPRVKGIFDFVYGDNFKINYFEADSELDNDIPTLTNEVKSLMTFISTFRGIERGDTENILTRLYESHPIYCPDKVKPINEQLLIRKYLFDNSLGF